MRHISLDLISVCIFVLKEKVFPSSLFCFFGFSFTFVKFLFTYLRQMTKTFAQSIRQLLNLPRLYIKNLQIWLALFLST